MNVMDFLSALTGLIAGVGGAAVVIWKVMLPHVKDTVAHGLEDVFQQMEKNAEQIRDIKYRMDDFDQKKRNDYEAITKQHEFIVVILEALLVLLETIEDDEKDGELARLTKAKIRAQILKGL